MRILYMLFCCPSISPISLPLKYMRLFHVKSSNWKVFICKSHYLIYVHAVVYPSAHIEPSSRDVFIWHFSWMFYQEMSYPLSCDSLANSSRKQTLYSMGTSASIGLTVLFAKTIKIGRGGGWSKCIRNGNLSSLRCSSYSLLLLFTIPTQWTDTLKQSIGSRLLKIRFFSLDNKIFQHNTQIIW